MDVCGLLQCNTDLIGNKLFTPAELEPAILVLRPNGSFEYGGSRITVTCVAFGSPTPSVIWGSPTLGIANLQHLMDTSDMINIYTEEINNTYGDALVFSPWKFVTLAHLLTIWSWSALLLMELLPTPLEMKMPQSSLIHMVRYCHVYLLAFNLLTLFSIFVGKVKRNVNYPKSLPSLESMCL